MQPESDYFHKTWGLWASIVTVATGIVSLTAFSVNLSDRVVQLEKQIDQLQHQPATSTILPSVTPPIVGKDGSAIQPIPNAVAAACADLAKRSADEISRGSWLTSEQIQKTMAGLQCGTVKN